MRSNWRRRLARAGLLGALLVFVLASGGLWYIRGTLAGSLPIVDGERPLEGLAAPASIARDSRGIPTVTSASRLDAARVLGFLHAQERFFQMDLQRRQPAGELAALVGPLALGADRRARVHRFGHIAREAYDRSAPSSRDLLDAYAAGVNAGLAALDRPPFEYLVLGVTPAPWTPEDSILTLLAMFNTLQGRQAGFELTLGALHDALPPALYDFLASRGSDWDAPVKGNGATRPAIPGPNVFDLRRYRSPRVGMGPNPSRGCQLNPCQTTAAGSLPAWIDPTGAFATPGAAEEAAGIGSNNWVVAGRHTASGAALLANDMHLPLGVPNIWYRAVMRVPDVRSAPPSTLQLAGFTLPGLPSLVVGSNGHVAWGFTNSGGDWSDLIVVEPDPRQADHYITPQGPRRFDDAEEIIEVAGAAPETVRVRWTMWGPIVGRDVTGRLLAQKWVAHDPALLGMDLTVPERALSVADALDGLAGLGIPGQNVVVGDRDGHIGWTIAGPIPRRRGHDGVRPTSWADGTKGWDGYLSSGEFPRIVDPPDGRIWTANAPVVDGAMLETIGEGGYADGIRARMIRDRLMTIDRATPADMLAVQLDDGALFHERWRTLVLAALGDEAVREGPYRLEFRRLVESTWTGRASPDSVAYRLVRSVRQVLVEEVFDAITAPVRDRDDEFDFSRSLRSEGPLWQLVTERPRHLLNPRYQSWDDQILAAIDETIADLTTEDRLLSQGAWGAFNRAQVRHPLAGALPLVGGWLNMPDDPLSGDIFTPRAHSPRTGPSERIVVSPGREEEGIAHMPTGQSGHPLSPYYADEHRAWVEGTASPFLPGPARHTLTLRPASESRR